MPHDGNASKREGGMKEEENINKSGECEQKGENNKIHFRCACVCVCVVPHAVAAQRYLPYLILPYLYNMIGNQKN